MVKLRRLCLLVAVLLLASKISAKELGEYQLGDTLEQDVIAPTALTIVDAEATDALKQKEGMRVPAVIRLNTNAVEEVVARFRRAFAETQNNFLEALEGAFQHRVLTSEELGSVKFSSLAVLFQKQNKLFPASASRFALWARGDTDEAFRESLANTLRQAMSQPIRVDRLSANVKIGATVRLVPTANNEKLTAQIAEQRGANTSRTNLVALSEARKDIQAIFVSDERPLGKYLASLLKANCAPDADVTAELRAQRTEGLWSADKYEAGRVIAHRGDVVDKKIKAALDQVKEKAAVGQLQAVLAQNQVKAAQDQARTIQNQKQLRWLIGGLTAAVLILVTAIWQLARRKPAVMLPVPLANTPQGEEREMIRAGVIAQLSRWLSNRATQKLISQRSELLDTQKTAAIEMAELEARLEKIHVPLQERLSAYERRIEELEKELAQKGEENRELIKAKIEAIQQQMEIERGKNRLEFN